MLNVNVGKAIHERRVSRFCNAVRAQATETFDCIEDGDIMLRFGRMECVCQYVDTVFPHWRIMIGKKQTVSSGRKVGGNVESDSLRVLVLG